MKEGRTEGNRPPKEGNRPPKEGRTEGRKEGILRKEGRNDVKGYGRKGRKEGKDPPPTCARA